MLSRSRVLILLAGLSVSGLAGLSILATRSPLFHVQVVELADYPENAPVSEERILELARVPVGKSSLFSLDLAEIEKRVLVENWVSEVSLRKVFPQTLSLSVKFRAPVAAITGAKNRLAYLDREGEAFGRYNPRFKLDVPLISGVRADSKLQIRAILKWIGDWEASELGRSTQLSDFVWDEETGLRAHVRYSAGRTAVELGHEFNLDTGAQLERLAKVFRYLGEHSLQTRQIWADSDKKIVVKTARGS